MRYRLGPWTPQGDSTQIGAPVIVKNAQPTIRGSYREIGGFTSKPASMALSNSIILDVRAVELFSANLGSRIIIRYLVGGLTEKVYEYGYQADTYTDITRAVAYTIGGIPGGSLINHPTVSNGVIYAMGEKLQYSSGLNSVFTDLSADANAAGSFVVSSNNFIVAFGSSTWACSALSNPVDWIPSIATQSATGLIEPQFGNIEAVETLADEIIVYKKDAMFRGRYVGPPVIWEWTRITNKIGALGYDAVLAINNVHYFISKDKFYIFDGSFPREIPAFSAIRDFVLFGSNLRFGGTKVNWGTASPNVIDYSLLYNQQDESIWILPLTAFNPGNFQELSPFFYIYDLRSGQFGVGDMLILKSLSGSPVNSGFFTATYPGGNLNGNYHAPAVLSGSAAAYKIYTRYYEAGVGTGTSGSLNSETFPAEFQFGPYGAEDIISHLSRLRLIMYRVAGNVTVKLFGSDTFHGTFVQYYTKTVNSSTALLKFDAVVAGCSKRWHKITVQFAGEFEFDGFDLNMQTDSKE